ncbi:MAG: DUF4232 domain-containing protein [Corynebacteriales bacterium]|nr:DUF4232 domain-containing protein [Mycobacteriales bacterium]
MSRLLALLGVLAMLAACGSESESVSTPSKNSKLKPTSSCSAGLELRAGSSEAATGVRVQKIELVNCGAEPVVLDGYPQVKVLDESGRAVDVEVGNGSSGIATVESFDAQPQQLTLTTEGSAVFSILWRNTYDDVSAPPVVGAGLEVVLAPGGAPLRISGLSIDLGSTGKLGLSPWGSS